MKKYMIFTGHRYCTRRGAETYKAWFWSRREALDYAVRHQQEHPHQWLQVFDAHAALIIHEYEPRTVPADN